MCKCFLSHSSFFPHTPPYGHHVSTKSLLTFSANFNFLNASNCLNLCNFLSLLTCPYLCITAMTTDHSIYPIYSMAGASSSQPSSCLSPPPSVQSSKPPQPPPSPPPSTPSPSSSATVLSFPFPLSLEVPSSCSPDQPTPMETPGAPTPATDKTPTFA